MMMAVYGGVAVVGQAVESPSERMAMIICIFIVEHAHQFYTASFYHLVNGGSSVLRAGSLGFALDVAA